MGGGAIGRVENKTDDQLAHGFAVGYYGPFWAMRAALPSMKERAVGPGDQHVQPQRRQRPHGLAGVQRRQGEALRALTRTAAREWAPTGVTVNAICPAAKSQAFLRAMADYPGMEAIADAANRWGGWVIPYEDIAPVAVFLAGEGSRYLTGNTLFVDGGSHQRRRLGTRPRTLTSAQRHTGQRATDHQPLNLAGASKIVKIFASRCMRSTG